MKDIINKLYSAFYHIIPIGIEKKASLPEQFPVVGFLSDEKITDLERITKVKINKACIYEQALTHRSYLTILGTESGFSSNERLEFLGDSLLNMFVTDFLFRNNPGYSEGDLTKIRSRLVNKDSLSLCGHTLGLERFIMMSFSAEKALKDGSDSILADMMEALIAAIYIDSTIESARKFVINKMLPIILDSSLVEDKNYKSLLLEKVQSLGFQSPKYQVLNTVGPDHHKEFTVGVYVDNQLIGTGIGKNKKSAEQAASENAIELNLFINIKDKSNGNVNI